MSLSDILTAHADAFRQKTGTVSKITIADMTRMLDDLTWRQSNLLQGTSDQWKTCTGSGWLSVTTAPDLFFKFEGTPVGTVFTYSATINNTVNQPVELQVWLCDEQKIRLGDIRGDKYGFSMSEYLDAGQTKDISVSFPQLEGSVYAQMCIYSQNGEAPQNSVFQVKNERLYTGTLPGVWTPNPADKVGGVAKALLCALHPVRGCAA